MITKREAISLVRNKLKEVNADSLYSNKFIFYALEEDARWMIRREKLSKLMQNKSIFQYVPCMKTLLSDQLHDNCPIRVEGLEMYRSEYPLPDMWEDDKGPIIKRVTSIDLYTEFKVVSQSDWESKTKNPYLKRSPQKYCIYDGGYLWFPKEHPRRITVEAFFKDDVAQLSLCESCETPGCVRWLDTNYRIPSWIESELVSKVSEKLAASLRIQADENINKNPNTRQ